MEPLGVMLNEQRDDKYPKDIKEVTAEPAKRYKPPFMFPSAAYGKYQA